MEGFLESYQVLDLTDQKGHLCGRILGDMGADVIKIEPTGGDLSRHTGPFINNEPDPEQNLNWFYTNANKRGVTLNLEKIEGKEIFMQLVGQADLIIESFKPGYLEALGLGFDKLCEIKSDIILTSISPFGQSGPYADYKVTDIVAAAMGGMAGVFGDADRPPVRISAPQSFFLGSQHGAVGSLTALYHREMTGEGQWVDVSIQETICGTLTYFLMGWEQVGMTRIRSGPDSLKQRPGIGDLKSRWMYPCLDGYVCLAFQGAGGAPIKSSRNLVAWANDEGYAFEIKDYQWETWDSASVEQSMQETLQDAIAPFLATKTKIELLEGAVERRILLAPVYTVADLPENPQFQFRDYWQKVAHPELGTTLTYPGPAVRVEQCLQQIHQRAPLVGEHNKEIFQALGYSSEKILELSTQGVI